MISRCQKIKKLRRKEKKRNFSAKGCNQNLSKKDLKISLAKPLRWSHLYNCIFKSRDIEPLCIEIICKSIKNNRSLESLTKTIMSNAINGKISLFDLSESF